MKTNPQRKRFNLTRHISLLLLGGGIWCQGMSAAHAANYYWDIDQASSGAGGATPSGLWNSSGTTWSTSAIGDVATSPYTTLTTDDLFFSAGADATGAYTISLTDAQNAGSLTFEDGSATISGTGGAINLGGAGGKVTVGTGLTAVIGGNTNTVVTGSVGLTKLGSGTLTLNGSAANTFTGGLNVGAGTLALDYSNLATPANLVSSANSLSLAGSSTLSIVGQNLNGATTVQSFSGATLGNGVNTLNIAKGASATSVTLNLDALTINPGSATMINPTTLWATGTPSATEIIKITSVNGNALPASGKVNVNAGLFYRNNVSGAAGTARWVSVDSAGQLQGLPATITTLNATTNAPTLAHQISTADVTFTTTTASSYGLVANPNASRILKLADNGTYTINGILGTNTFLTTINPGTGTSNLVIGPEKHLVINLDNTGGVTINAPIANNGSTGGTGGTTSSVTVASTAPTGTTPGTVIFAGANTYTGDTFLVNGTLQGNTASTSLTPASPFSTSQLKLQGGTLQLRATGTENATAETILFGNNTTILGATTINVNRLGATSTNKTIALGSLSIGSQTLTVTGGNTYGLAFDATTLTGDALFNPTTATLTLGAISERGGSRSLTKAGAGTLQLTAASTYTGPTTINAGTLSIGGDDRLGTVPVSPTAGHLALNGGTLQTTATMTLDANRGITVGSSNGTINVSAGTLTYNGTATGPGTLTKLGTGTLSLSGNNSYNGFILGTGTSNISTTNTATANSGGVVLVGHNNALGTGIVDSRGAQIRASTTGIVIANDFLVGPANGGLRFGGVNNFEVSGDIAINSGTRSIGIYGAGTTVTLSGTIDLSGSTQAAGTTAVSFDSPNVANFGAKFVVTGPILGSTTIGGVATGTNFKGSEITLANAASTFDSVTLNEGTMNVAQFGKKADAAGYLGTADTITFATGGATLKHTGAAETSDKDFALTANGAINSSGGGVTLSGTISGAGGFTKTGTSPVTLTGANNYTGPTTVAQGTLIVGVNGTGSIGTSTTTVAAGATLGGSGTIGGATTVDGRIAPGNSIGTLNVTNNVTWNAGNAWVWELGTGGGSLVSPGSSDLLHITGDFIKGANSGWTFDFSGTGAAGVYKIVDWSGSSTFNPADFTASNFTGGLTPSFIINNSALYLELASSGGASGTTYTLGAAPATLNILKGGNLAATSTITNTGLSANNADTLNFTNLSAGTGNASVATASGNTASGGPLANNSVGTATTNLVVTGVGNGSTTITSNVATATNGTIGGNASLSGSAGTINVTVGNASFDGTNSSTTFGPALSTLVSGGVNLTSANFESNSRTATVSGGGPAKVGTTATIVRYDNSLGGAETVSMSWRSRTAAEADLVNNPKALLSDVVRITGMGAANTDVGTFLLEMTYDLDQLQFNGLNETSIALSGELQLAWRNNSNQWVNAVAGNTTGGQFFAGVRAPTASDPLGTWGIDTSGSGGTGYVWAVLNHNSDFAVIPEPSTFVLGGLAFLGLASTGPKRRRHKKPQTSM